MNLVSATHGAAKYIKQNNYRFNNWLLSLQSYQMGAGGVMRAVGDEYNGAKHMEITSETYWYVKKFLAHKVTFENALTGEAQLKVITYQPKKRKTLKEIANELSTEEGELKEYNKWLKTSEIPDDKLYTVLVPVGKHDQDFTKLILSSDKAAKAKPLAVRNPNEMDKIPAVVNSIPVIVARAGETVILLAQRGKVDLSTFLKHNDIPINHPVEAGEIYFLARKKTKGAQEFYKTKPGDDLWNVSQQFGVRVKKLKKYNRINEDQALAMGSLIWLRGDKPKSQPFLAPSDEVATLEEETFDWYIKSPKEAVVPAVPFSKQAVGKPVVYSFTKVPITYIGEQADTGLAAKPNEHIVKPGDTFYSIAKEYGIEVSDLLAWNDLTIQNGLMPSQIIKVVENEPVKTDGIKDETTQSALTVHEVKSTDTLYSIARQYGVTIKDIMDWNHKTDFSLSRGEKLEIRQR